MPLPLKDWTNGIVEIEAETTPLGPYRQSVRVAEFPAEAVDAFSRLRVSAPGYRYDSQLTYRIDADLWDSATTNGTVAHSATERWATLTADASGANSAVLQSHYAAPYTPGRGQLAFITFLMGAAPGTAGYKRAGYYNGTDGVYLERTATAVNLVLKSSTSKDDETVPQASWNIDPMDGTGPSGKVLDLTKMQILVVQMQALYVGSVTIGFDIGGSLVPVHRFSCANEEAFPYIAQASLPVRYEVGGTAATTPATVMRAVCASVISEGGADLVEMSGRPVVSTGSFANLASAVLCAVRVKSTLNSIANHAVVIPEEVDVSITDAGAWVLVLLNPEITAGTWTDIAAASCLEESFAGNAGTDPTVHATNRGTVIERFYVSAAAAVRAQRSAGLGGKVVMSYSHLLSAGDVLAVVVEGGATTDGFGTLRLREIR